MARCATRTRGHVASTTVSPMARVDGDALRREGIEDGRVVDEVAENRQWAGVGLLQRERDGVAHAEAHAEVGRSHDAHTLRYKVYCTAHCVKGHGRSACVESRSDCLGEEGRVGRPGAPPAGGWGEV